MILAMRLTNQISALAPQTIRLKLAAVTSEKEDLLHSERQQLTTDRRGSDLLLIQHKEAK